MQFIGAALTVLGCLFAIWTRFTLGSNWSGRVTLKTDHSLVVRGPYSFVRHPIYTGILLAVLGTVVAVDQWKGLIPFFLVIAIFMLKINQEERLMMQTFPEDYGAYRKHVKALIPGLM